MPLNNQLEFLKTSEKKFKAPSFTKKELDYFGIYQKTNTFDEMKNAIQEYQTLIQKSFVMSKKNKIIQKNFWKVYPKVWYNDAEKEKICLISKKFLGKFIISNYYIKKYKEFIS